MKQRILQAEHLCWRQQQSHGYSGRKAWAWPWENREKAWRVRMRMVLKVSLDDKYVIQDRNLGTESKNVLIHTHVHLCYWLLPRVPAGLKPAHTPGLFYFQERNRQEALNCFPEFFPWLPIRACCPESSWPLAVLSPTHSLMSCGFLSSHCRSLPSRGLFPSSLVLGALSPSWHFIHHPHSACLFKNQH